MKPFENDELFQLEEKRLRVNLRDLYNFLCIKEDFRKWAKRNINELCLRYGTDYIISFSEYITTIVAARKIRRKY